MVGGYGDDHQNVTATTAPCAHCGEGRPFRRRLCRSCHRKLSENGCELPPTVRVKRAKASLRAPCFGGDLDAFEARVRAALRRLPPEAVARLRSALERVNAERSATPLAA